MTADQAFQYDVAFSFLSQDEALAVDLNERLKDRVTTFIYSDRERQETLISREGEEAFRLAFSANSRGSVSRGLGRTRVHQRRSDRHPKSGQRIRL